MFQLYNETDYIAGTYFLSVVLQSGNSYKLFDEKCIIAIMKKYTLNSIYIAVIYLVVNRVILCYVKL